MNKTPIRKAFELFIALAICHSSGIIGSLFTINSIKTWYVFLNKPSFNPPNWVFGPVWTVLYTMMGFSLYLAWRDRGKADGARRALLLFAFQLFLNALWTPVFFGARLLPLALIIIVGLCVSIAATIAAFSKYNRAAAVLLIPYLLWVMFASALNYSLWILNRTQI